MRVGDGTAGVGCRALRVTHGSGGVSDCLLGVGDTLSGNATFKVTGYSERGDDEGGCTLDLEATEFAPSADVSSEEKLPEDNADDAFSNYESDNMGGE